MADQRHTQSAEEKGEIERLAETLKKPTPAIIAMRLNRHPATIAQYMIRHGLIERTVRYSNRRPGRRSDGTAINFYTAAQDRRLVELRRRVEIRRRYRGEEAHRLARAMQRGQP